MRLISLQSSNIASVGYDPATEEMQVVFQTGEAYRYHGVPAGVYLAVITDPDSHGKAFASLVRRAGFPYEKIDLPSGHV